MSEHQKVRSNYDKYPFIAIDQENVQVTQGWEAVCQTIEQAAAARGRKKNIVVLEC